MAEKSDKFYFEGLAFMGECVLREGEFLVSCLENYDTEKAEDMLRQMHETEHRADKKKQEINAALSTAFITPFDREDISRLTARIDDAADSIEEVLQSLYIGRTETVLPEALMFSRKILLCCQRLYETLSSLKNPKKRKETEEGIISVGDTEEECDRLYLEIMSKLRDKCTDIYSFISWKEIFEKMEKCADMCERAADSLETVLIKNP